MLKYDTIRIYAISKERAKYLAIKTLVLRKKKNIKIHGVKEVKLEYGDGYNVSVSYEK